MRWREPKAHSALPRDNPDTLDLHPLLPTCVRAARDTRRNVSCVGDGATWMLRCCGVRALRTLRSAA